MKPLFFLVLSWAIAAMLRVHAAAADPVFSGPQIGEKATPFHVLDLTEPGEGKERDPIAENSGAPTALVFIHSVERSLVPLLRVVDQYGAGRTNLIKAEIVFLSGDRLQGAQRARAAARSLRLKSRVGLSLDGAEGPGNYGLNKDCLMTIIAARSNIVTANFALVQPGIVDGPKVIEALARACGDSTPPTVAQLSAQQDGPRGRREMAGPMAADRAGMDGARAESGKPKEAFPGAVPDDPKLNALLRQSIRPTNDDATVDRLLTEMKDHINGNADLTRQARDGWIRVLHFGDHYGTAYARKSGRQLLEVLTKEQPQK